MFKKFDEKESVSGITQLKSSVQKGIRKKILETYQTIEQEHLDAFMPKKQTYRVVKCHEHLEILVNDEGTLLFFKHRDGPWIPTLRLLHEYPYMLVPQRVDKVRTIS
jgi:PUA domain protein